MSTLSTGHLPKKVSNNSDSTGDLERIHQSNQLVGPQCVHVRSIFQTNQPQFYTQPIDLSWCSSFNQLSEWVINRTAPNSKFNFMTAPGSNRLHHHRHRGTVYELKFDHPIIKINLIQWSWPAMFHTSIHYSQTTSMLAVRESMSGPLSITDPRRRRRRRWIEQVKRVPCVRLRALDLSRWWWWIFSSHTRWNKDDVQISPPPASFLMIWKKVFVPSTLAEAGYWIADWCFRLIRPSAAPTGKRFSFRERFKTQVRERLSVLSLRSNIRLVASAKYSTRCLSQLATKRCSYWL